MEAGDRELLKGLKGMHVRAAGGARTLKDLEPHQNILLHCSFYVDTTFVSVCLWDCEYTSVKVLLQNKSTSLFLG